MNNVHDVAGQAAHNETWHTPRHRSSSGGGHLDDRRRGLSPVGVPPCQRRDRGRLRLGRRTSSPCATARRIARTAARSPSSPGSRSCNGGPIARTRSGATNSLLAARSKDRCMPQRRATLASTATTTRITGSGGPTMHLSAAATVKGAAWQPRQLQVAGTHRRFQRQREELHRPSARAAKDRLVDADAAAERNRVAREPAMPTCRREPRRTPIQPAAARSWSSCSSASR
jgi:hypothetical protein